MAYNIIMPADHEAWLQERQKGIGSSDAGTIMGASPFSTPLRLWRQRMGLEPPVKENRAMRFGHAFEPAVAEFFALETGSTIDYASEGDWMAVDEQKPYLRVSPDRLFWPPGVEQVSKNWRILEIKTTRKHVDKDNPPLYWYCQVQYQMGVMGIKHAVIAYLTSAPNLDADWIEVEFNPAFFETLVSMIDKFWNVNILGGIEPEATDSQDAVIKYPTHTDDKSISGTDEILHACINLVELKKKKKDLEAAIAQNESMIRLAMQDAESLSYPDTKTGQQKIAVTYRSINETVLDEERLKKEHPEIYDSYSTKIFDKSKFVEENKDKMPDLFSNKKGARRLTVKPITDALREHLGILETKAAS